MVYISTDAPLGLKEQRGILRKRKTLVMLAVASRTCLYLIFKRLSEHKGYVVASPPQNDRRIYSKEILHFNFQSRFVPAHRATKKVRKCLLSLPSGLGHLAII